jgi:hypothetical protein
MRLQHDGAPLHFGRAVTTFLNQGYERKWMGRGRLVAWPAQSSDLNQLDSFLWGCMKLRMYHGSEPEASHQLVKAIEEATVGIRNLVGWMRWQYSVVRQLAGCMCAV